MNMYEEIVSKLDRCGYSVSDIAAITCDDGDVNINTFLELAKDEDYDEGYGGAQVASDLVILLKDGHWFERREYDGAEWWQLCSTPKAKGDAFGDIQSLSSYWGGTLKDIQDQCRRTENE